MSLIIGSDLEWNPSGIGVKRCSRCGETKDNELFSPNGHTGLHSHCKRCRANTESQRYANDPSKGRARSRKNGRAYDLRHKYGITHDEYDSKLHAQHGTCAICGKPETVKNRDGVIRRLAIDHCHRTSTIRDLLCHRCNRVLGLLHDDAQCAKSVVLYLERWSK